jgi:hypothetical protein
METHVSARCLILRSHLLKNKVDTANKETVSKMIKRHMAPKGGMEPRKEDLVHSE